MSRRELGTETLAKIAEELPDLASLWRLVLSLLPDPISMKFSPDSRVPVAAVCLRDTVEAINDAKYALHEALAHRVWYLEKREVPLESTATHFTRYYCDDLALRLYSASEHLANAILCMLEIDEQRLQAYTRGRTSQQSIVGHFLLKEEPNHKITKEIKKLVDSSDWCTTMNYRNQWVHDQPPLIENRGIAYERRPRWVVSESSVHITFGGGDKPKYSALDLLTFTKKALFLFVSVVAMVAECYVEELTRYGITLDTDGTLHVNL